MFESVQTNPISDSTVSGLGDISDLFAVYGARNFVARATGLATVVALYGNLLSANLPVLHTYMLFGAYCPHL